MAQAQWNNSFDATLNQAGLPLLRRSRVETLQINLGRICNQTCAHCHVDAGPNKTESMPEDVALACIKFLKTNTDVATLDITGGAPEMNPYFRLLAKEARAIGRNVISRCNLTILLEPGYEDLANFYATNEIEITASLPCYTEESVDKQRGRGVFEKSLKALRLLNSLGYGTDQPGLRLNLVYNPQGTELPPPQFKLEEEYKRELLERYDISFDQLYTITNMPIARFERFLHVMHQYDKYMQILVDAFNPDAAMEVMCKTLLSVSWDGRIFDCDFNQMLDMPLCNSNGIPLDIRTINVEEERLREILTGSHCFGCTAGAGSSCAGAIAK